MSGRRSPTFDADQVEARARLVRAMKAAVTIRKCIPCPDPTMLVQAIEDNLCVIMPELAKTTPYTEIYLSDPKPIL